MAWCIFCFDFDTLGLNPAKQLGGWKHCNLWHMYHIINWCGILFINSVNWLFWKCWKPTSLVMSHFVILPWFCQPRRYGPLDGFWIPKCVTTGAQNTSVGSFGTVLAILWSKMEVKFQVAHLDALIHLFFVSFNVLKIQLDVISVRYGSLCATSSGKAFGLKLRAIPNGSDFRFGVASGAERTWGAPYRQASLSHWGKAPHHWKMLKIKEQEKRRCSMLIDMNLQHFWMSRNPLQRLWVVFWFGGEHSVWKRSLKTLLSRSKCFSGHEKMFTCMNVTWQRCWNVYEWKSTIAMSSLLRHPPTPSGKSHVQLDTQDWDCECSAGAHLANTQLRSFSMKSLHGLVISAFYIFLPWNPSFSNNNKWRYQARCTPSWVKHQHFISYLLQLNVI